MDNKEITPKIKPPKNLIQELLQKHKLQFPKYETVPIKINNRVAFLSKITLFEKIFEAPK